MIVSKTPMRLSFAGGGSDLPAYYREAGGAVISVAIDKYVYLCVNKAFDDTIRVAYSKTEEVTSVHQIEHKLVRAALTKLDISGGVEIASVADIPSRGSGLGSSSAFTVGLLNALHTYQGRSPSQEDLAREACEIEIDICGEPIGKQDQYGAAVGGLKLIQFNADESVVVKPVHMPAHLSETLAQSLMMFYTGVVRSASDVLSIQSQNLISDEKIRLTTKRLVDMAYELSRDLSEGRSDGVGESLHEGWMLKKTLADGISNPFLDDAYEKARAAGAIGGKLLGAGGGGFLVFYVPIGKQDAVRTALSPLPLIDFGIDHGGTNTISV